MRNELVDVARLLARTSIFAAVPGPELAALAARCRLRELRRGDTVFTGNERAERTWLVVSGLIRVASSYNHDEPTMLDLLGPGQFFGALDGAADDHYAVEATALGPASVVTIPAAEFRACIRRHPAAAAAVIDLLAKRLAECGRLRSLAHCCGRDRLLRILLWLHGKAGGDIPLTRQLIGEAAVLTRETATRLLSPLEKRGWIKTRRGIVAVKAPDRIEKLARNPRESSVHPSGVSSWLRRVTLVRGEKENE